MPMIQDSELLDLTARVFSGEASPEERILLARWSQADPEHAGRLDRLRQAWQLTEDRTAAVNVDRAIARVRISIASPDRNLRTRTDGRFLPSTTAGWVASTIGAAAMVLALVGIQHSLPGHTPAYPGPTTYVTTNGQRTNVVLPDGATAILNVASRLELPAQFGDKTRTVNLSGEASFNVAHDERAPFIVNANGTRTEVLGTEFSVRGYDSSPVEVAVRSGRVSFNRTILGQSDIAHAGPGGIVVLRAQGLDAAFGFTTGRLVFRNVRLRDAIADLNRWYNVDIQLDDAVFGDRMMNAICTEGSIETLIDLLKLTFDVEVARNGRTLTLSSL